MQSGPSASAASILPLFHVRERRWFVTPLNPYWPPLIVSCHSKRIFQLRIEPSMDPRPSYSPFPHVTEAAGGTGDIFDVSNADLKCCAGVLNSVANDNCAENYATSLDFSSDRQAPAPSMVNDTSSQHFQHHYCRCYHQLSIAWPTDTVDPAEISLSNKIHPSDPASACSSKC